MTTTCMVSSLHHSHPRCVSLFLDICFFFFSGWDYCFDASRFDGVGGSSVAGGVTEVLSWGDENTSGPSLSSVSCGAQGCFNCQGDCENDSDCAGDLICFSRGGFEPVRGCSGRGKLGKEGSFVVVLVGSYLSLYALNHYRLCLRMLTLNFFHFCRKQLLLQPWQTPRHLKRCILHIILHLCREHFTILKEALR